jgi:gamma-glutamyl phosphate reductase
MSDLKGEILRLGQQAKKAALELAKLTPADKNRILLAMADRIEAEGAEILEANARDVAAAEAKGLTAAMIDRLVLNPKRLAAMAEGVRKVAGLPDPVGEILDDWTRPNGLRIVKKRVPIGTIGIIYESRPNVTSDAAVLCFKSGNATILRGGSEAFHSNQAIAAAMSRGGVAAGMPEHAIQLAHVWRYVGRRHEMCALLQTDARNRHMLICGQHRHRQIARLQRLRQRTRGKKVGHQRRQGSRSGHCWQLRRCSGCSSSSSYCCCYIAATATTSTAR